MLELLKECYGMLDQCQQLLVTISRSDAISMQKIVALFLHKLGDIIDEEKRILDSEQ